MSDQHAYWNDFYAGRASSEVPAEPSAFATWVEQQLPGGQAVVEVGFGNARDSLWFARRGRRVLGFDFAESAVTTAQSRVDELDASFATLDLYDVDDIQAASKAIAAETVPVAVYGRFLIHALEDAGRHNLLDLAAGALPGQGGLYLEFRTGQDRDTKHLFGEDHYRQYVDPDLVADEIRERGGDVTHLEAGHGLAVYKTEDPHVARLVARWS
jgi:methyltransferase family protein